MSQQMPLQSRRWNSSLFTMRSSRHSVEIAHCRLEDVSHSSSSIQSGAFGIIDILCRESA
ncbi:hypothetical protein CY34DRAFT_813710 [Suillus luteus UH-Slu-Lm8-n1]|uniref:Uncharacterized protein n=1 Tax=Suillus luteus UH-Slu-Lm8-n1 TaxID=930992 RepID=A0A0C9Z702_9AGAM|nr:hypothetical protein CY34DRAFT_813710 [Suillus luteus UH-Slu-Lm8-n1]